MPRSHLTAKISAPGVPEGIVLRERLFCLLDKGRKKPVVWISGPGGSGKTTLAASYLRNRALPHLWYQVDEGDADPGTFFYRMGLARQESTAGVREPLPLLAPEYLPGIKTFARRYFERLFRNLPLPFTIVLDSYQDVSPYAAFHEIISEGLALIPKGVTVMILSRNEPPPLFALLDYVDKLAFLGWSEMRFSFPEAAAFVRLKTGSDLDHEALVRLHGKTDGWIAGLLLILEGLGRNVAAEQVLDRLPLDQVFAYFAEEIFNCTERETQEFLLKTAFMPGLTAAAAEQLTGLKSAERLLARLARNHFFTEKRSAADPVYRYHPLFREFLLARAKKAFTATGLQELRQSAAAILEEAGRIEEAAQLFLEAADWVGVTDLILKQARSLTAEGRCQTLEKWLLAMPEGIILGNGWLLYWLGHCRARHDLSEARGLLEKAWQIFKEQEAEEGIFLAWSTIVDTYFMELEDWRPLDDWLVELGFIMKRHPRFSSREIEIRVAASRFVALVLRPTDPAAIREGAKKILGLLREADIDSRLMIYLFLCVHHIWTGDYHKNILLISELNREVEPEKSAPLAVINLKLMEAMHYWLTMQCDLCMQAVDTGLEIAKNSGIHGSDYLFLACRAENAMLGGDRDQIAAALAALNKERVKTLDHIYYYMLSAWQALLEGNTSVSYGHLTACAAQIKRLGSYYHEALWHIGMAQIFFAKSDLAQAQEQLDAAFAISRRIESAIWEFVCLLMYARLCLARGEDREGVDFLRRAMALGREHEYLHFPWWQPAVMAMLCTKALEEGIEVDYVRELIGRRHLIPERAPVHIETWPWPLKIRTFGSFELLHHGAPVAFAGKVQKKPLELLKALLAFGGANISEQRLADALWPEADGDYSRQSFDTTLHRLRKLIGNGLALQFQAGRLSLDPRYCWIDTQAFMHLCSAIDQTWQEKNGARDADGLMGLTEKAVGLYRGHFLSADRDLPWTRQTRDRMRMRFRQILARAGGYWEEQREWEKAVAWYQRGIDTDQLAEEFYQRLMICHQSQGQTNEAVLTYRRLREALSGRLDLALSQKTEEIYRAIVKKN